MPALTLDQIAVWLIVGALAGSLTGMVVKRSKKGFGIYGNLGVGLVGALLGGLLFRMLGINLGLGNISVSIEDLIAAFAGSLLFLLMLRLFRSYQGRKSKSR